MSREDEAVVVRIAGELRAPAGGIVVLVPLTAPIREATVGGVPVAPGPAGEIVVQEVPATVVVRP